MAYKNQLSPRSTITLTDAGSTERQSSRLINGTRTYALRLRATGSLDVTVAGTGLQNRGSIWAAIDKVIIEENGRDRHTYDGRVLRYLTEMHAPSALSSVRPATAGIATTALEETATVFFAHPLSAAPHETAYREADARQSFDISIIRHASAENKLVAGGTKTLGDITVTVEQLHDPRSRRKPVFIPSVRQIVQTVAAANTNLETFLKTSQFLRAVVVQQEDTTGEIASIINGLRLRGDFRDLIGPQSAPWDELVMAQESEFGGNVLNAPRAYLGINFQQSGRLSNVVNPQDDVNLRFEFDVTPAGANSQIRITMLELERVPGLVRPNIPFAV